MTNDELPPKGHKSDKSDLKPKRSWKLFRRRECLVPTRRGWLVIGLFGAICGVIITRTIHPFLAVNDPKPGGILVVEGWAPDYALAQAVAEFNRNHYEKVFVTGIPIEHGAPLSEFKTYAELGAAVLVKLGLSTNVIQAVPTPLVLQDRTFTSAKALRSWLREHSFPAARLNVFTEGPHARRSRLLYQKAMGKDSVIGVIAAPVQDYDPNHWWKTSPGVRAVIGEAVAYAYVRLFFWPAKE